MKRHFFTIVVLCFFGMVCFSQEDTTHIEETVVYPITMDYGTAAGVRVGDVFSAVLKHFIDGNKALEVIMGFERGISIIGVMEIHKPLTTKQERLNWFYGFGGYLYFTDFKDKTTFVGIAGAIGAEYTLPNKMFAISMDWNPVLSLVGDFGDFNGRYGGVSLKYVIQ